MILGCLKIGEKDCTCKNKRDFLAGQTGRQTRCQATFSILNLLLLNLRWAYSSVTSKSFTF